MQMKKTQENPTDASPNRNDIKYINGNMEKPCAIKPMKITLKTKQYTHTHRPKSESDHSHSIGLSDATNVIKMSAL